MAFVNEYISDEDVEKYGIAQLREELHANYATREHWEWTRDRERDAYLMRLRNLGRDLEPELWLLYEKSRYCAVMLHDAGGSIKLSERPFRMLWHFDGFDEAWPKRCPVPAEEEQPQVIQLLKEALTAYGYAGMRKQLPETIVSFNF